jgi:uncharacterized protein (TIGR03083 family)
MLPVLSIETNQTTPNAIEIPYVTADEAYRLMSVELERFFALIDTLEGSDWDKPTACTAWSVRDILAHQAGGFASGTGYRELFRQLFKAMPKPGQLPEDALNALQLAERTHKSPEELAAEVRRTGPVAARKWSYQFQFAKLLAMPHAIAGTLSLRYLMWVIHSRDTWMHRLDICRATGRPFAHTPDHDRRIVALIMRDVALQLARQRDNTCLIFELTGHAGGVWKVGHGEPACTIRMDALDFSIFASGRFTPEQALARAQISGDTAQAEAILKKILILF